MAADLPTRQAYLSDLYEDDPAFKAVVDAISFGGYADDDGVWHPGPTLRDAEKAVTVMGALAAAGYVVTPIPATTIGGSTPEAS